MVGDRLIVTNNHLIPYVDNFRTLQISVRLGSRTAPTSLQIAAIQRDPDRDLAVLKLAQPVVMPNSPSCPVPLLDRENIVPIGSSLYVLGYPVDQDLSITDGIISNKSGPGGRWQTSAPINPGNSGGPAFGESGILIGFAVSGIVKWKHGDDVITVQGVNFVIPTYNLLQGPLAPLLEELRRPTTLLAAGQCAGPVRALDPDQYDHSNVAVPVHDLKRGLAYLHQRSDST